MKETLFVACSDAHIRDNTPSVYGEFPSWWERQFDSLRQMVSLAKEKRVPLIIAGDLFDSHHVSFLTLWETVKILHDVDVCFVYGQHDLYGNNVENAKSSPAYFLRSRKSRLDSVVDRYDFGTSKNIKNTRKRVAVTHELLYKDVPFKDAPTSSYVKRAAERFKKYEMVVSGDNHQHFAYEHGGVTFLNCGMMSIQRSGLENSVPSGFIVYDDGSYESVEYNTIRPENIRVAKNEKEEKFVKSLAVYEKPMLSFEKELLNGLREDVVSVIVQKEVKTVLKRAKEWISRK